MPEYTVYRLEPETPFHIGTDQSENATSRFIHSDTVFSGFANSYRKLYGNDELEELLGQFCESPPFKISSAFPYIDDEYLFPLPMNVNVSEYTDDPKKLKKTEYLAYDLLSNLMNGDWTGDEFCEKNLLQKRVLLSKPIEDRSIWALSDTPRVVIDRVSSESTVYYMQEVSFHEGCGLFILVDFVDQSLKPKFEACLRLLGEDGLGGERTYGRGVFTPRSVPLRFDDRDDGLYYSLSLVYPEKSSDMVGLNGWYGLVKRAGWVYSPDERNLAKPPVHMFTEGSVFNKPLRGHLVDVTPKEFKVHDVYRYGYSFYLRMAGSL